MEQRSHWVDYAKAIGIILVVFGHVLQGLYNTAGIIIPQPFYDLSHSIVYSFHIPLFFFLSGLFFYQSLQHRGKLNLIGHKVDTIVYPYILWSIIQGSIETILSGYTNGNTTYSGVFYSLLWAPRAQFWFLYTLFVAFLLATMIASVLPKRFTMVVLFAASTLYLFPGFLLDIFISYFIANNFVFFVLGMVFSLHNFSQRLSHPLTFCLLAIMFIAGQFIFHRVLNLDYADRGMLSLLLAVVSILFVVSLSLLASRKPNKLCLLLGTSSMAIYFMHIIAGSGLRVVLKHFLGIDSFAIHLVLGCLAGVFAPLAAYLVIKKFNIPFVFSAPISKILVKSESSV